MLHLTHGVVPAAVPAVLAYLVPVALNPSRRGRANREQRTSSFPSELCCLVRPSRNPRLCSDPPFAACAQPSFEPQSATLNSNSHKTAPDRNGSGQVSSASASLEHRTDECARVAGYSTDSGSISRRLLRFRGWELHRLEYVRQRFNGNQSKKPIRCESITVPNATTRDPRSVVIDCSGGCTASTVEADAAKTGLLYVQHEIDSHEVKMEMVCPTSPAAIFQTNLALRFE